MRVGGGALITFIRWGFGILQGPLRPLSQQGTDTGEGEVAVLVQTSSGIAEVTER